jgi:hypothetical protein
MQIVEPTRDGTRPRAAPADALPPVTVTLVILCNLDPTLNL